MNRVEWPIRLRHQHPESGAAASLVNAGEASVCTIPGSWPIGMAISIRNVSHAPCRVHFTLPDGVADCWPTRGGRNRSRPAAMAPARWIWMATSTGGSESGTPEATCTAGTGEMKRAPLRRTCKRIVKAIARVTLNATHFDPSQIRPG